MVRHKFCREFNIHSHDAPNDNYHTEVCQVLEHEGKIGQNFVVRIKVSQPWRHTYQKRELQAICINGVYGQTSAILFLSWSY